MPRIKHSKSLPPKSVAKHKKLSFIDKFIYVIAVAEPLANIPQIVTIFRLRNASSVSLLSWCFYAFFGATWLIYGIHIKQKPMVIGGLLFVVTDLIVVAGAILYGAKFV